MYTLAILYILNVVLLLYKCTIIARTAASVLCQYLDTIDDVQLLPSQVKAQR